jgi:hypothetical protein
MKTARWTRRLRPALPLTLVVLALAVAPLFAQEETDFKLFRPMVSITTLAEPDADLKDVDGQYGQSGVAVAANIPLGGVHIHSSGKLLGDQFFLSGGFGTTSQRLDTPAVNQQPRLYNGVLAGSVLFLSRKGNFYFASAGASFAEDQDTLGSLQLRPYGIGLGSVRTSPKMMLVYGGAFTYIYGRGLLLPVFGLIYTPNKTWTISGAVPFSWRFSQRLNDSLRMNYVLWVSGQRYRFNNDNGQTFPGQDSVVYERVRERHIGAELEYHPTRDIALLGQVGLAGGRLIGFSNPGEDDFVQSNINGVPYVRLTARFAIGKSLLDKAQSSGVETPGLEP